MATPTLALPTERPLRQPVAAWRRSRGVRLARLPFYLLSLTMIAPFYWLLISVFKPPPDITKVPPSFVPQHLSVDNFHDGRWSRTEVRPPHQPGLFQVYNVWLGFWHFMLNSLVITTAITVGSLLIASLAAYVITKHRIRGRKVLFLMIISSMMVPWQTTLVPNYLILRNLGWLDSYQGYIVPALAKAFVVFFLVQYLHSIPDELIQAARVDGAGEWRIWWTIVLPLLRPALAAMSIFIVLAEWNNFLWPLIIVQSDKMANVPVALARVNSYYVGGANEGMIMAGGLLASLPTVVFFLVFQRYFTKGIVLGGLKG